MRSPLVRGRRSRVASARAPSPPAGRGRFFSRAGRKIEATTEMNSVHRYGLVASEKGLFSLVINVQVPASTHYSMVFYFVSKPLVPGSLLQLFVDGDDEFRNSRFKLIPAVPKYISMQGSWIVRQSVGSTPCLLGKAVDCTYIRGSDYLEVSYRTANYIKFIKFSNIFTSVLLISIFFFLSQANTYDELPERLIGAVRVSHVELSSAIVPSFEANSPDG
ncbi:hypothetical protein BHM03_00037544 [Ensete ventricosum]|nr:hypothetical protein BHM03_00037544 [Ensete ventricosum]